MIKKSITAIAVLALSVGPVLGTAAMASAEEVSVESTETVQTSTPEVTPEEAPAPVTEAPVAPETVVEATEVLQPESAVPAAQAARDLATRTITPTTATYIQVLWEAGTGDVQWPEGGQTVVTTRETESKKLDVKWAKDNALKCNTTYQTDLYNDDKVTRDLIAGGKLYGAGNPAESWPGGKYEAAYSNVFKTAACAPTTVVVPNIEVGYDCFHGGNLDAFFALSTGPAQNANGYEFLNLGFRAYFDQPYTGAGKTYVVTFQKVGAGFDPAFPYGTKLTGDNLKQTVVVPAATGYQSADSTLPCYVPENTCVAGEGTFSTPDNDLWANVDTREKGHVEYTEDGLHIYTEDNSGLSKVSEGMASSFALKNTGVIAIDYTSNFGIKPGVNLFVTFADGQNGTLVYEDVYGQDLWLTNGSNAAVKASAKAVDDPAYSGGPVFGGGNGSQWHGTINQWLVAYPDAVVNGIAYSLGSGVYADGIIHSITVNCAVHEFGFEALPENYSVQGEVTSGEPECGDTEVATSTHYTHYTYSRDEEGRVVETITESDEEGTRPLNETELADLAEECVVVIETAPLFPTQVDECGTENDSRSEAVSTDEYTIETVLNEDGSADYTAVANDGYEFAEGVVTTFHLDALTDEECPVTVTPPTNFANGGLIITGVDDIAVGTALATAAALIGLGVFFVVRGARRSKLESATL